MSKTIIERGGTPIIFPKRPKGPWNTGLTKETDKRVAQMAINVGIAMRKLQKSKHSES